jgi:hypothetical protein
VAAMLFSGHLPMVARSRVAVSVAIAAWALMLFNVSMNGGCSGESGTTHVAATALRMVFADLSSDNAVFSCFKGSELGRSGAGMMPPRLWIYAWNEPAQAPRRGMLTSRACPTAS